jgi:hypothetical protein
MHSPSRTLTSPSTSPLCGSQSPSHQQSGTAAGAEPQLPKCGVTHIRCRLQRAPGESSSPPRPMWQEAACKPPATKPTPIRNELYKDKTTRGLPHSREKRRPGFRNHRGPPLVGSPDGSPVGFQMDKAKLRVPRALVLQDVTTRVEWGPLPPSTGRSWVVAATAVRLDSNHLRPDQEPGPQRQAPGVGPCSSCT